MLAHSARENRRACCPQRTLNCFHASVGGLRNRDAAQPLMRLFHIALAGETHDGSPTVSTKDLSLLLDVVVQTKSSGMLQALLASNALTVRRKIPHPRLAHFRLRR